MLLLTSQSKSKNIYLVLSDLYFISVEYYVNYILKILNNYLVTLKDYFC